MKKIIKNIVKKTLKTGWWILGTPFAHKKSMMDLTAARRNLSDFSPKPKGKPFACNKFVSPIVHLQIVVPAYNAEAWLEECMESILSQKTKYTYRVILIDDGSTDHTPAIADRYAADERVKVIHQPNAGFSGARNTGLKELFGQYVMFVDSDDKLYPGAIETLLDAAFEHDSDIVVGGNYDIRGNDISVGHSFKKDGQLTLKPGALSGVPWGKVFKASCFENIIFPEGYWYEDSIMSFLVYPGKSIWMIEDFVYLYRLNPKGITQSGKGKPKAVDSYWITELLMQCRSEMNLPMDKAFLEKYLRQIVLNQNRMARLPEFIQESAFILSAEMMTQYFDEEIIRSAKYKRLVQALADRDWGMYKLYCACH